MIPCRAHFMPSYLWVEQERQIPQSGTILTLMDENQKSRCDAIIHIKIGMGDAHLQLAPY